MGSIGTGEILVIALVALIVFGPKRLPELTRKAGELMAKARQMTQSVADSLDAEYGEVAAPLKDLKGEYDATIGDMKGLTASITDMTVEMPDADWKPSDAGGDDGSDTSRESDSPGEPDPETPSGEKA